MKMGKISIDTNSLIFEVLYFLLAKYALLVDGMSIDTSSPNAESVLQLVKRTESMLKDWGKLLRQYLKGAEEQVDLLLTLEEFCSEEPPFGPSSQGKRFITVFARVRMLSQKPALEKNA